MKLDDVKDRQHVLGFVRGLNDEVWIEVYCLRTTTVTAWYSAETRKVIDPPKLVDLLPGALVKRTPIEQYLKLAEKGYYIDLTADGEGACACIGDVEGRGSTVEEAVKNVLKEIND